MKKLLLLTALLGFIAAPALGQTAMGTIGPGAVPCAYTDCKVKTLAIGGATIGTDALAITGTTTFGSTFFSSTASSSGLNGSLFVGGATAAGSQVYLYRGSDNANVEVSSTGAFGFSATSNPSASADVTLWRQATGIMEIGNTTTAGAQGSLLLTNLTASGAVTVASSVATPAAGSTSARLLFGTTAGFGIYYGSGAPTVSAAQGSIYLRSDGSSTSTRLYINTNGSTTWTNVTTAG